MIGKNMFLRHIKKIISWLTLLITTTGVYAQDNMVPCPSLEMIHQAAQNIQNANDHGDGTYFVYTTKNAIFAWNFYWQIGILDVSANSKDEAILNAKARLQNASIIGHQYAYPLLPGSFYCNY